MLVDRLARAADDGLSPDSYSLSQLQATLAAARTGDPTALAQAELALSRAYADYMVDLHRPNPAASMVYVHDGLAPSPLTTRQWLEAAARAPSLAQALVDGTRMNPLYEELRAGLAAYRARWSVLPTVAVPDGPALKPGMKGPRVAALRQRLGLPAAPARYDAALTQAVRDFQSAHGLPAVGVAGPSTIAALNAGPAHYEQLIRANLERARAIPADPGRRFILVDTGNATLRAYEDGRVAETMRVVVGKPSEPTPAMAGRISFAVLNPYWNLPPDLARVRAQRVLAQGVRYLASERLEALSGWEEGARRLAPDEVDWQAVASGQQELRMRQLPGGQNFMGKVKFMLPNRLGIYLHDTPEKQLFADPQRRFSSGCVRLEDAARFSRWIFNGNPPDPDTAALDQHVDLPEPVPVYITYLTAAPRPGGFDFRPDIYRRDPTLLAALDRGGAGGIKTAAR